MRHVPIKINPFSRGNLYRLLSVATLSMTVALTCIVTPANNAWAGEVSVGKKGFGLAESAGGSAADLEALRVHWYYNWGASSNVKTHLVFVPMAFSPKRIADVPSGQAVVLGFNEPDNDKQSDVTVQDALQAWPALSTKGKRIGAPAMAKNPLKPGNWLPAFMEHEPRVDFITVHWYKGVKASHFIEDIEAICKAYSKPVWVTEFAPQTASDSRDNPSKFSQAEVDDFIRETTAWMEKSDCVQRYAWHDSKVDTSSLVKDGQLTESGKSYAKAGRKD